MRSINKLLEGVQHHNRHHHHHHPIKQKNNTNRHLSTVVTLISQEQIQRLPRYTYPMPNQTTPREFPLQPRPPLPIPSTCSVPKGVRGQRSNDKSEQQVSPSPAPTHTTTIHPFFTSRFGSGVYVLFPYKARQGPAPQRSVARYGSSQKYGSSSVSLPESQ